jgi:Kef-type K+ transport system membrane component KefB
MKVKSITVFYLFGIAITAIGVYVLHASRNIRLPVENVSSIKLQSRESSISEILKALTNSQAIIILQVAIIILAARLTGLLFKKINQPIVMGEIVAGIILGPSVLGLVLPDVSQFLFPKSSLSNLQVLSNIGLLIFMFIVGMEFKLNVIKEQAKTIIAISYASIILPFILGVLLALTILKTYLPANLSFFPYALYIGVAISITSFTVLARIMRDRGITNTRLGLIVISCTALNDIIVWCILAVVIATVKAGSSTFAMYTLLFVAFYVAIMILVAKPFVKILFQKNKDSNSIFFLVYSTLLVSSYISEVIGVHMLFGAFLAGTIMPADAVFRKYVIDKLENFAFVLLLPLYFAFTGLRTQIGLLGNSVTWVDCIILIVVAIAGKFIGCTVSARLMGEQVKTSLSIGVMMNTRGLTELVVLNIGYELGILKPELFTIMVIMALFTTLITTPILNIINKMPDKIKAGQNKKDLFLQKATSWP